ncbi:hypothetical protein V5735_20295 (plasmid) [Haladaptatus sp. SPP-AMP-3]|uniref:hypothetical protein n=1 Tax=Haladaptatus sp. SPP-AMP-3 TaxID=3121295 RepID=UPI003C2EEAD2
MKTLINKINSKKHSILISCVKEYHSFLISTISWVENTEENIGEKWIPYSEKSRHLIDYWGMSE